MEQGGTEAMTAVVEKTLHSQEEKSGLTQDM